VISSDLYLPARTSIPITKFGEDSIGVWFFALPGTTMRMESLPYGLAAMVNFAKKLAPGSMERVNVSIQNQIKMGGKIIEETGGVEKYDDQARKKKGPKQPKMDLNGRKEIIFRE